MSRNVPNHIFDRFLTSARRYEDPWRRKNQQCFEYVDGDQWTEEEISNITDRGQQPTVINTILPTIDMVCSVAMDRQCDIQVVGREGSDDDKATQLTALLKHVFDAENFDYFHQAGFRQALIGGRSWFEVSKYTDERGKDLIKIELVPWENVYVDPHSRLPDASDARYIIKVKWLDRDVVKKLFPDKAVEIDNTFDDEYKGQEYEAQMSGTERDASFYYDVRSRRVRICECYYTMPEKRTIEVLDERTGKKERKTINEQRLHYVIFSDQVILQGSETDHSANEDPIGLNMYPLIPLYCMRDRDGRPRGIVKSLVDIQDQINKLNSKFLWTLMTNRIIAEEGALKDPDEARIEFQKPDGLIIANDGGLQRIRVDDKYRDLSYMSSHLQFLLATEQRLSGVNDSMLGLGGTNERSGVMQSTRISQGAAMQTSILENMYFSKRRISYFVLRMIGKYYTDYRVIRITQPNGTMMPIEFNKVEYGESGEVVGLLNEIEDTLYYDVLLKKTPPFTSVRAQQLSIFSEVLKSGVIPPPVAAKLLLALSDIPNKQDLLFELENFYKEQAQIQSGAVPGDGGGGGMVATPPPPEAV